MTEHQHTKWKESWRDEYFVESWGRGIELIRDACAAVGTPIRGFQCDSAGFRIEFPSATANTSLKTSVKTPVETLRLPGGNLEMTLAQVAAEINKTVQAVELAIAKLVKDGKLRHVGPQKGGYREVLK